MTSKERTELENLRDICECAISYVGSANYRERQETAHANVSRAFEDFESGKKIKPWDSDLVE